MEQEKVIRPDYINLVIREISRGRYSHGWKIKERHSSKAEMERRVRELMNKGYRLG